MRNHHYFTSLIILFSVVATVMTAVLFTKEHRVQTTTIYLPLQPHPDEDEFSKERFIEMLKSMNIRHWDLVYAQAYLETGGFKSDVFLQNNNLFGMKVAGSRPTTAMYEDRGHAVYVDWRSSVVDFAMYYSKYLSRYVSRSSYLNYLGENYAEDKNYVRKLLKIKV